MPNQFFTFCKRCGKQILMTQDSVSHRWFPCNPQVVGFVAFECGPSTFVSAEDGSVKHGYESGSHTAERGYYRHRRDCV